MAIQPGSLDYLYYNGILDHIPYEAYSTPTMSNYKPAYDPTYLDNAKKGYCYQYEGIDTFVPSAPASVKNYNKTPAQEVTGGIKELKNKIVNMPTAAKGLISGGVIVSTIALLIKRIRHK